MNRVSLRDRVITLHTGLLCAGEFVDATGPSLFDSVDPFDGQVNTTFREAGPADINRVVTAAVHASKRPELGDPAFRAAVLRAIADKIDANREWLAALETLDSGKLFTSVHAWDVPNASAMCRYYADLVEGGAAALPPGAPSGARLRYDPRGVCALVLPWNFPMACAAWKLAPALAAGCPCVLKPSERASLSVAGLMNILSDVAEIRGLVGCVYGGPVVSQGLIAHAGVRKVALTGGTRAGRAAIAASASNVAHLTLELGNIGKALVLKDADLAVVVPALLSGIFGGQGQNCAACSEVYIERPLFDAVASNLITATTARAAGDPFVPETVHGPMVDCRQVEWVKHFVNDALRGGARVLATSRVPGEGAFYPATLLTGAAEHARVFREEVFGPVGVLTPIDDAEEGLARINATGYGLSTGVFSSDRDFIRRAIDGLAVGTVWVNCFNRFEIDVPYGGVGLSGYGRELGVHALDEYRYVKAVYEA